MSQGLGDGVADRIEGPGGSGAQVVLDLRPHRFNRIEVWRVRGQVTHRCTDGLDRFGDVSRFVSSEVVHHHELPGTQGGGEDLFDISAKGDRVGGPVEDGWREGAIESNRRDDRRGLPVAMGDFGDESLALGTASPQAGEITLRAGFVNEHKATNVYSFELVVPDEPSGGDVGPVLLGGVDRLFLNVSFNCFNARQIVLAATWTPSRSRSSASVASG